MSNPFKAIGKALKSVVKGVGKVFKKIGKGIKSLFSSSLGKAVLIGAGLFFGIPAAAGALGVGASGTTGAAAWWSSTFSAGAGATAGGAGATTGLTGAGAAATGTSAAVSGAATNALPVMTQAGSHAGLAAKAAGMNAGGGLLGAAAQGASLAGSAAKGVAGAVGSAAKGAASAFGKLSPTAQAAVVNVAGQGIAGHYEQKAAEEAQKSAWAREDEVYNRGGSWGIGNDGREVPMPESGYQSQINSPTGLLAQTNQRSTGFNEQEEAERLWEQMSPAERMQAERQMSAHRFG